MSSVILSWGWHWCYVCTGVGEDKMCEESPQSVTVGPKAINCTNNFCTAIKVTHRDNRATHSIARLCENEDRGNWCYYDKRYITCYVTCATSFCNDVNPKYMNMPKKTDPVQTTPYYKKSPSGERVADNVWVPDSKGNSKNQHNDKLWDNDIMVDNNYGPTSDAFVDVEKENGTSITRNAAISLDSKGGNIETFAYIILYIAIVVKLMIA
ncbi:unnamed protein product [Owenia fusiformis]|uniref:Uncharacterized protein n=1 Tax=Owenia fusiformis TaxID=6347 RepID=A0A8S4N313_OWEFU|nr:unnamed protein product [Owenia fusiformis]